MTACVDDHDLIMWRPSMIRPPLSVGLQGAIVLLPLKLLDVPGRSDKVARCPLYLRPIHRRGPRHVLRDLLRAVLDIGPVEGQVVQSCRDSSVERRLLTV